MHSVLRPVAYAGLLVLAVGLASTFFWLSRAEVWPAAWSQYAALCLSVLIVAAATVVNLFLRWLRWHYLLRRLGARLPNRKSVLVFTAMLPAIASPLAVAEILVGLFLRQHSPTPWRLAVTSWLLLRLADVAALVLIWSLALGLGWAIVLGALVLGLIAVVYDASRVERANSLRARVSTFAVFLFVSLAAWACVGVGVWLASYPIGYPISLSLAGSAFAQASLVGALSLLPAGVVTTGSMLIHQLQDQLQGMPLTTAVQFTLGIRLGTVGLALLLGVLAWLLRYRDLRAMLAPRAADVQLHFDDLAASYDEEIPGHIRARLLDRKLALIGDTLEAFGIAPGARGFDLGCGQGWYAIGMAKLGFVMSAGDLSAGQLGHAMANGRKSGVRVEWKPLEGGRVPAASASLDFIYAINVLHHVVDHDVRASLFDDMVRALRPGGVLLLHEMNTLNPLFRLYMSYIFPLLRRIDDGTERWLNPQAPPPVAGGRWSDRPTYFTFLPDFGPAFLFAWLGPLERRLEGSSLARWSAHYQQVFVKGATPAQAGGQRA